MSTAADVLDEAYRPEISFFHWSAVLVWILVLTPFLSPRIGTSLTLTDVFTVPAAVVTFILIPRIRKVAGDRVFLSLLAFAAYGLVLSFATMQALGVGLLVVVEFQARILESLVFFGLVAAMTSLDPRWMERSILCGIYAIGLYALYQIGTGHFTGFYGFIGLPGESGPPQGGQLYGMSSLFFIYMANSRPKHQLLYLSLMIFYLGFTVATISRSTIGGVGTVIVLFPLLLCIPMSKRLYKRNMRLMTLGLMVLPASLLIVAIVDWSVLQTVSHSAMLRLSKVGEAGDNRLNILDNNWALQLRTSQFSVITGLGLGSWQKIYGIATLAFHSQYLRLIFETGVIGLLLWLYSFFAIFKRIADLHRTYLFFAIIISIPMFFMGFTHEVFYVGKPDAVLCMMLGFFTGLAYCARNQKGRLLEVVTPVNGPFVMLSRAAKTILRRPTIAG